MRKKKNTENKDDCSKDDSSFFAIYDIFSEIQLRHL